VPLDVRSIAVKFAVLCFFLVAAVGLISELSPFACAKRAAAGAVIAYVTATFATRIINTVLINAMAAHHANKRKETNLAKD